MLICVARFTGRTRISAIVIDMVECEELVVSRSWIDRKNGKVKEVAQCYKYAIGELSSGCVSIDLGRDCIVNIVNGIVKSIENPNGLSFGLGQ